MKNFALDYVHDKLINAALMNSPFGIKSARIEMVRTDLPYPHDERGMEEIVQAYISGQVFPERRVATYNDAPGEQGKLFGIVTEPLWQDMFSQLSTTTGDQLVDDISLSQPYSVVYDISSVVPLERRILDRMWDWIEGRAGEYDFFEGQVRWAAGGLAIFSVPLSKSEITLEGLDPSDRLVAGRWIRDTMRRCELSP